MWTAVQCCRSAFCRLLKLNPSCHCGRVSDTNVAIELLPVEHWWNDEIRPRIAQRWAVKVSDSPPRGAWIFGWKWPRPWRCKEVISGLSGRTNWFATLAGNLHGERALHLPRRMIVLAGAYLTGQRQIQWESVWNVSSDGCCLWLTADSSRFPVRKWRCHGHASSDCGAFCRIVWRRFIGAVPLAAFAYEIKLAATRQPN